MLGDYVDAAVCVPLLQAWHVCVNTRTQEADEPFSHGALILLQCNRTLRGLAMSATAPPPELPPAPAWREIGRAAPENPLWVTWVALIGESGSALYRSLFVGDNGIAVAIDLRHHHGAGGTQGLHRSRSNLPQGSGGIKERINSMLTAADDAVALTFGNRQEADQRS